MENSLTKKISITLDIDAQASIDVLNVLREVSDDIDEALQWALEVLNKTYGASIEDIMGAEIKFDYNTIAKDADTDMGICYFDRNGIETYVA